MKAGLDALPDDVLLQLIKACSRDTPDAGGMPELEVRAHSGPNTLILTADPGPDPNPYPLTLTLTWTLTLTLTLPAACPSSR